MEKKFWEWHEAPRTVSSLPIVDSRLSLEQIKTFVAELTEAEQTELYKFMHDAFSHCRVYR